MAKYTIEICNAGGVQSVDYATYDNARDAIRNAARIGRRVMESEFGPTDYRLGEVWDVTVTVDLDETGEIYEPKPCIYIKYVPTTRPRR